MSFLCAAENDVCLGARLLVVHLALQICVATLYCVGYLYPQTDLPCLDNLLAGVPVNVACDECVRLGKEFRAYSF